MTEIEVKPHEAQEGDTFAGKIGQATVTGQIYRDWGGVLRVMGSLPAPDSNVWHDVKITRRVKSAIEQFDELEDGDKFALSDSTSVRMKVTENYYVTLPRRGPDHKPGVHHKDLLGNSAILTKI